MNQMEQYIEIGKEMMKSENRLVVVKYLKENCGLSLTQADTLTKQWRADAQPHPLEEKCKQLAETNAELLEALNEIKEAFDSPGVINEQWLKSHVTEAINKATSHS